MRDRRMQPTFSAMSIWFRKRWSWSRGQLENEVNQGSWYIFDGSEGIVFDSNPSTLWSRMIARTELDIARVQSRFDGRSLFGLSSSFTLSSSPRKKWRMDSP